MENFDWSKLNKLQIGKYAEYYVKMEFTLHGWQVYSSEIDDRGIDFVVKNTGEKYFDIQVKSIRKAGYVFCRKKHFELRENLILAVAILRDEKLPDLFLIPSKKWKEPNKLLVEREYQGKKSDPEWGVNISTKNMPLLDEYQFEKIIRDV